MIGTELRPVSPSSQEEPGDDPESVMRRAIVQERLEALAKGDLILLSIEDSGTYNSEEIYTLEQRGYYVEPVAFGIAVYGPDPVKESARAKIAELQAEVDEIDEKEIDPLIREIDQKLMKRRELTDDIDALCEEHGITLQPDHDPELAANVARTRQSGVTVELSHFTWSAIRRDRLFRRRNRQNA